MSVTIEDGRDRLSDGDYRAYTICFFLLDCLNIVEDEFLTSQLVDILKESIVLESGGPARASRE